MVKRSEKGYILAKKALKRATKMGSQWVPFGKNPHYQHCWCEQGCIRQMGFSMSNFKRAPL